VRPSTLDLLGLRPALNELIEALEGQSDVQVNLDVRLPGRLAEPVETAVYRLIQDALSMHMVPDRVGTITVRVQSSAGQVTVTITDFQGRPPSAGADSEHDITMLALIERTELLGGSIRRNGTSERGSSLQITLPLDEPRPKTGRPARATDPEAAIRTGGATP